MASREVRDLQEELSRLTSFRNHPGYEELMKIAEDQLDARIGAVLLTPLNGLDETLKQEFEKGEISGIKLFVKMTDIQIQTLKEEIEDKLTKEQSNEPDVDD